MPLLIHSVVWWLVGLLAGSTLSALPWRTVVVVAVAVGAFALWRRHGASLLLLAGLLAAHAARAERERCTAWVAHHLAPSPEARDIAAATPPRLWFHTDVIEPAVGRRGAMSIGTITSAEQSGQCAVHAMVLWATEPPPYGAIVAVQGTARPTNRGVRLEAALVTARAPQRDRWRAWRGYLATTIDAHFGARASLVKALLIADQRGIAPEVRERYADAGLVHLLSVSGMHVAIIASALLVLGGAVRVPRPLLEPMAMALVAAYVLLLGCPAPAVRSAVMLIVLSLSARLQRPLHEWTALALGAAVPTVQPLVVTDLGWQLSVGGMAALVAARAVRRAWRQGARLRPAHRDAPGMFRWRQHSHECWVWLGTRHGTSGWLVSEITTGVIATVVTAPIIAWTFGRVSLIAPLSNLVAGPIIAVLQPALFLGLLGALSLPGAWRALIPDATQPLMALLDVVATAAAAMPGAVLPVAPMLATAVGTGVAAALFVRGTAHRRLMPWLVAACAIVVVTIVAPLFTRRTGHFEMHVLDVGQGDAVALRLPSGRWVLVDAGPRWQGGDAGRRTVVPYVRRHGGDVALFVLSHAHDDHAGGASSVVRALGVPRWWEPAFVSTSPGYRQALNDLRREGALWERVRPGTEWHMDSVTLSVLAPDSAWTEAQNDANETSVVLKVRYGQHHFLLTGDAERDEEQWLLDQYAPEVLAADVLKLGHHGSRTSSTPAFLNAVQPRVAIASVGAGNRYGHPATETLLALHDRHTPVLRTDRDGTIVVRSDGRELSIMARGERWIVPTGSRVGH